jgi:hypothetical protein
MTFNNLYLAFFIFKNIYINILHECEESRDVDKLFKVESIKNEFEKSTMHPLYNDEIDLEEVNQNIHDIKEHNTL